MQPRIQINFLIVDNYAEAMSNEIPFPPVELVYDDENYWMWDGFHRYEAIKQIGLGFLDANITDGTQSDAEWLALSANKEHGLHRANVDKRRSVKLAFEHRNSKEMSDRLIAEHCGVSNTFVGRIRDELSVNRLQIEVTRGNSNYTMTVKPPTKKIIPEVRKLIDGTEIGDNPQELKALSTIASKDQEAIVDLIQDNTSSTIKQAKKEFGRLKKLEVRQNNKIEIYDNDNVWHGDFREVGQKIPDNSVDLIFTDPPYNEDAIQLYRDLGVFAARVLKPGGLCLAYSGQIFLPQVLNALSESLEYIWCFAVKHNGAYTRIFKPKVNNAWKPIMMYCKPAYEVWWTQIIDLIEDKIDKSDHEWQQSTNAPDYYLNKLCPTGGLVIDPFCGSGTTLLSAKKLDLRYIGIEDDIADVRKAVIRLK